MLRGSTKKMPKLSGFTLSQKRLSIKNNQNLANWTSKYLGKKVQKTK